MACINKRPFSPGSDSWEKTEWDPPVVPCDKKLEPLEKESEVPVPPRMDLSWSSNSG